MRIFTSNNIIWKFLTSFVTASAENLYPLNFSKLYKIIFILGTALINLDKIQKLLRLYFLYNKLEA